jgi:hypothetical protein
MRTKRNTHIHFTGTEMNVKAGGTYSNYLLAGFAFS